MKQLASIGMTALVGILAGFGLKSLTASPTATIGTRGAVVGAYPTYSRCKPRTQPCEVKVTAQYFPTIDKCRLSVDDFVFVFPNQEVKWTLADPAFEFDKRQGIDVDGNHVDDGPTPTNLSPIFAASAATATEFSRVSTGALAKALRYTIVVRHKASGTLCIYDPVIVNRD